jgi:thiamine biosynthesis lipoprotein
MKKTPLFTVLFISLLTVLLAAVFLILTKTGRKSLEERAFFALDTYCSIKIDHAHGYLLEAMEAEIRQMDEDYSRYRPGSRISRLNRDGLIKDRLLYNLLKQYLNERDMVRRYFRPETGHLMDLWDFSRGGRLPDKQELKLAVHDLAVSSFSLQGEETVILPSGLSLDLGGLFKGLLLDRLVVLCRKEGAREAVINLGGDVALFSSRPRLWKVGIRDPRGEGVLTWVEKKESLLFIVTSGDYERFFVKDGVRYCHILNPLTGYPGRGVISVTVIAESGLDADILSTAYFAGAEEMDKMLETESKRNHILWVRKDGEIRAWNLTEEKDEKGRLFFAAF